MFMQLYYGVFSGNIHSRVTSYEMWSGDNSLKPDVSQVRLGCTCGAGLLAKLGDQM